MTDRRSALVTGVTGQDGAYLVALLLGKGYEVHGLARNAAAFDRHRLDNPDPEKALFHLHDIDLTRSADIRNLVAEMKPDEIYNLAAQSHVPTSFAEPEWTMEVNAAAPIRLMEAIIDLGLSRRTKVFQAASSEIFGEAAGCLINERSPMSPRNPYAVSKHRAYEASLKFRSQNGLFVVNGFLFNHESPYRSPAFVTRKISRAVAAWAKGGREPLRLGNLDARRDWGHARDYVEGMWLALQHSQPDDYVFATGENHSVRQFVELAFAEAGCRIRWQGAGVEEVGYDTEKGKKLVEVDPAFFRPDDIPATMGDASKARRVLKWRPRIGFAALVREMVRFDMGLTD